MEARMEMGMTENMEAALRAALRAGALINSRDISPEKIARGSLSNRLDIDNGLAALVNAGHMGYTRGHLFVHIIINAETRPVIMDELQAIIKRAGEIRGGLVEMLQAAKAAPTFAHLYADDRAEERRSNEQLIKVLEALLRGNCIGFSGYPEVADIVRELGCAAGPGFGSNSYYASLPEPFNGSWIWHHPEEIDNLEAMTCVGR